MHDNKVRLSQDVLEKAEQIANEWGLKNARAAVEAVFRKYCDDYHYGRIVPERGMAPMAVMSPAAAYSGASGLPRPGASPPVGPQPAHQEATKQPSCEAIDAIDRLLAL